MRGTHPFWSPDGTELFGRTPLRRVARVTISGKPNFTFGVPVDIDESSAMMDRPSDERNIEMTPDGKHFVGIQPTSEVQRDSGEQIELVLDWLEELKTRVPLK